MNVHFLIPGDINTPSGEYIYNKKIIEGLRNKKYKVFIHNFPADFPFPSENSIAQCEIILNSIPENDILLIPGAAFAANSPLIEKYTATHKIIGLIHKPSSMNRNLSIYQKEIVMAAEKKGFEQVKYCIVSNEFAKITLLENGIADSRIYLALPGIDNYPLKMDYPEVPYKFLCISNYTRKNGLINLVKALSALKDKKWELSCYGIKDYDPNYVDELNLLIRRKELTRRIHLNGPFLHENISEIYLNADLFIIPSDYESFGMSISESLMHGIPIIASSGGLINKEIPQKMGKFFKPGNIYDIQSILELLIDSTSVYSELCKNARQYHTQARSWEKAVSDFENALLQINLLLAN